ncbi:MAG TPA: alpha-amylase family glycosyl hydrolase, partial [Steroidobacteraceae bacterium]|nr:alpha-amylase family glycosyl hydrolase [Steroidobacteraceae bacterium]
MPFGCALKAEGGARFRLWAPSSAKVELELTPPGAAGATRHAMRCVDGWHEIDVSDAGAGASYRFFVQTRDAQVLAVPDPASRYNPQGVHRASMIVNPDAYDWLVAEWRGQSWPDAVLYELHVGTFTREGTFAAACERLAELRDLGVTALEIMPLAAFPGERNWGYDGVLQFAPASCYGAPSDLKALIDGAHGLGMMVLLDVVYNHFGPEGNYLHAYCPEFFNPAHRTPWGAAINFDGAGSRIVRDFFVHNALYWIEEYR